MTTTGNFTDLALTDADWAALDAGTEAKLQSALDEVMQGRTTFVIAHRLSTVRDADRILVFDKGRIIETGTFDELVAQGGRFAELARASGSPPKWNFHKWLVGRDGRIIAAYPSAVAPLDPLLIRDVERSVAR